MQGIRVNRYLVGSWFFGCLIVFTLGMSSAQGEFLEYTYPPRVGHVDLDKNIIAIYSNSECVIQRIDTGKRLWSLQGENKRIEFGKDALVVTENGHIQVLDKSTGKELWSQSGEHLKGLRRAYFLGDSLWVRAACNENVLLFTPEGKLRNPFIPGVPDKDIGTIGWMQDGETILLTAEEETGEGLNTLTTYFWKPESNHLEKGYVLKSFYRPSVRLTSLAPKALYSEYDANYKMIKRSFIDVHTGVFIKDLPVSNSDTFLFLTCKNGLIVDTNESLSEYMVFDPETGDSIAVVSESEHRYFLYISVMDKDKDWIFSYDKKYRCWLWPVEKEPQPRLIYTPPAGNYFPGGISCIRFPYIFFQNRNQMEAYLLDGMVRVKRWWTQDSSSWHFSDKPCSNLSRILARHYERDHEDEKNIWTTELFEAFNPYPVCRLDGHPLGLSPDGRYCAVQHPEKGPVRLVEVDSSKTCAVVESEKETGAKAIFSPDNRIVAIYFYNGGGTTLVSLEEPYTQRGIKGEYDLVFSPDGNYYASSGSGEVTLYDIVTDAAIHTFIEQLKVKYRYESPPDGFLETAGRFGRNLIGNFVSGHKGTPYVTCGFSEDSTQMITMASGQILRVWDIKSGKLIRTIYTKLAEERDEKGYINNYLVLSQNGSHAFAYNRDGFGASSLWDVNTGRMITRDYLPKGKIEHVSVADDGSGAYMTIDSRIFFVAGKKK